MMVQDQSDTYQAMYTKDSTTYEFPNFNLVWKWNGYPRIHIFIWKLSHKKLLTNVKRNHQGMLDNDVCIICSQALKTIMHI